MASSSLQIFGLSSNQDVLESVFSHRAFIVRRAKFAGTGKQA